MPRRSLFACTYRLAMVTAVLAGLALHVQAANPATVFHAFVGTYTGGKSRGIYVMRFDTGRGTATKPELAAESENPSFLAIHPSGNHIYCTNEIGKFRGEATGTVSAFAIDRKTGKLTALNQQPSGGSVPCHLAVDATGKIVFVANYTGGTFASLRILPDGSLDTPSFKFPSRAVSGTAGELSAPKAHGVAFDPTNRFVVGPTVGVDRIWSFKFDTQGQISLNDSHGRVKKGAGPRHFAFRPDGRFGYVINESNCTLTAFAYNSENGALTEIQTISTLPVEFQEGWSTAELEMHPSGKFLYGSNRGHDSIIVCAIDQTTGRLTVVEDEPTRGKTPRSFGIDPTGSYLLAGNQDSDTIVVFRIDSQTGKLDATGEVIEVPKPACVKFLEVK